MTLPGLEAERRLETKELRITSTREYEMLPIDVVFKIVGQAQDTPKGEMRFFGSLWESLQNGKLGDRFSAVSVWGFTGAAVGLGLASLLHQDQRSSAIIGGLAGGIFGGVIVEKLRGCGTETPH